MKRIIVGLCACLVLMSCAPTFPFNVNLLPFIEPSRLEGTVPVEGDSVTVPAGETRQPPFTLHRVPLNDQQVPLDVAADVPSTPIERASIAVGLLSALDGSTDALSVTGSASVTEFRLIGQPEHPGFRSM